MIIIGAETRVMAEVIRDTIVKFNRDTGWLAAGVVGTVIFAALVLAVQEHLPNAAPTERYTSANPNPTAMTSVVAKNTNPDGELTPARGSSVDRAVTKPSGDETVSPPARESAAPTSGLALKPQADHHPHRQDSTRERTSKTSTGKKRSSVALGSVAVKRRLIELWHQSLANRAKSRSWTAFWHLNKGGDKKAAYTAETSH